MIIGDCDGDGEVTLGEVQQTIGFYLGSMDGGGCGADCDGDWELTIGEVQRAINGYLGQKKSCFE